MKKIIQQSGLPKYLHLWQSTMNWQPDEGHILELNDNTNIKIVIVKLD